MNRSDLASWFLTILYERAFRRFRLVFILPKNREYLLSFDSATTNRNKAS